MLKEAFQNSSIYLFSNLFSKGLSILLVPVYTRFLTPEDYGILDMGLITIQLFLLVFTFQLNQAIARYYFDKKEIGIAGTYAWNSILFGVISFIPLFGLFFLFDEGISTLLFARNDLVKIVWLLCPLMLFQGGFFLLQSVLRYSLQPKLEASLSVILTATSLALVLCFVVLFNLGAFGIVAALTISHALVFTVGLILSRRSLNFQIDFIAFRELFSFSWPLIFSSLSVFMYTYIDRFMIRSELGLDEVGLYGVGSRIASVAVLVMSSLSAAVNPLVYRHYRDPDFQEKISDLFNSILVFVSLTYLGVVLFKGEILLLFTTPEYYASAVVIPFLVASAFISQFNMFLPGMEIAQKTKLIAAIYFSGGVINLLLNYLLIPIYGIWGASVATVVTSLAVLVVRYFFSQTFHRITYSFFRLSIVVGAVLLLLFALDSFTTDSTVQGIFIRAFSCLIFGVFFWLIGWLPVNKLMRSFRS